MAWTGQGGATRAIDADVRHDLEKALERCRRDGKTRPSLPHLAEAHDRRFDPYADIAGISERALRDRMRDHPQPFHELVPWITQPKKR